ncbi:MAG: hypothetical protein ACYDHN_14990 [Solirubrobacteraceae bacterium]
MFFQTVSQAGDAVLAGVVEVEGKLHEVGTLFVDDDRVDKPPFELDGGVLVADRRGERCAARQVLLNLALADLVG